METIAQHYEGYREGQEQYASTRIHDQFAEPQYPGGQAAGKLQPEARGSHTASQRLILAIISVVTTGIFSMVMLTSVQNSYSSLLGIGIMRAAIFLINAVFNWK
jgi:hypothetical protein